MAPGKGTGEFLVSSGQGGVFALDLGARGVRPFSTGFPEAHRWDNHLTVADTVSQGA